MVSRRTPYPGQSEGPAGVPVLSTKGTAMLSTVAVAQAPLLEGWPGGRGQRGWSTEPLFSVLELQHKSSATTPQGNRAVAVATQAKGPAAGEGCPSHNPGTFGLITSPKHPDNATSAVISQCKTALETPQQPSRTLPWQTRLSILTENGTLKNPL